MTATQDKWLDNLPHSSDADGTYWVFCKWTLQVKLAMVEWIAETKTYKICMPEWGIVIPHPGFNTFLRDRRWLRIEEPDVSSSDWLDKFPDESGYYWACNIETQKIFVLKVAVYTGTDDEVFVPEYGAIQNHPNYSTFLRDHKWLKIGDHPSPPESEDDRRFRRHHESQVEYERRYIQLQEDRAVAYERLCKAEERVRGLGCDTGEIDAEHERRRNEFWKEQNAEYARLKKELGE